MGKTGFSALLYFKKDQGGQANVTAFVVMNLQSHEASQDLATSSLCYQRTLKLLVSLTGLDLGVLYSARR
jgi:hypothetical protein